MITCTSIEPEETTRIDQDTYLNVYTKIRDVEVWTHGVWENQKPETPDTYDPASDEEWDWKPDEPMDSDRVLDCERWVVEMGRWQEQCMQLREEQSKGPLPEDV